MTRPACRLARITFTNPKIVAPQICRKKVMEKKNLMSKRDE